MLVMVEFVVFGEVARNRDGVAFSIVVAIVNF